MTLSLNKVLYYYFFTPEVPIEDVESALNLAILATESLHGESQTRLDMNHTFDKAKQKFMIEAGTPVGQDINRLFVGFIQREFDRDSFAIERIEGQFEQSEEEAE
jgi:hypothetical protein